MLTNVLLGIVIILLLVVISYLADSVKALNDVSKILNPTNFKEELQQLEEEKMQLLEQLDAKKKVIADLKSVESNVEELKNFVTSTINAHSENVLTKQTETNNVPVGSDQIQKENNQNQSTSARRTPIVKSAPKHIELKENEQNTEVTTEEEYEPTLTGPAYEQEENYRRIKERESSVMHSEVMEPNETDPDFFEYHFGDADVPPQEGFYA